MDRVGDSLVFAETYERPGRPGVFGSVVSYIVDKIYLGHNRTPAVKRTLRKLAEDFERTGGIGLNFGAGGSERRPNMVNLDVYLNDTMHVVYDGRSIPFEDETFDLVMSQEVFEHIPDCQAALDEVARVMKMAASSTSSYPSRSAITACHTTTGASAGSGSSSS